MKKVIDYSTREIIFYKFVCNDPNIISSYVGSTIDFTKRKYQHKSRLHNIKYGHLLLYKTICENGGWDNWKMLEIERLFVKNKQEALQREQYWIELQIEKLNMCKSFLLNSQDYYNENRVIILEKKKIYHIQNKDAICFKVKVWRDLNKDYVCEKSKEYREKNKEHLAKKNKEWREINKVMLTSKKKEYNDKNKEKISLQRKTKYQQNKELKLMANEDKY